MNGFVMSCFVFSVGASFILALDSFERMRQQRRQSRIQLVALVLLWSVATPVLAFIIGTNV